MRFQTELVPATLVRRYKRFLADCRLADGREITAHVANPGAMTGLAEPGTRAWLEPNDDPRKKLEYAWRIAEPVPGTFVAVDTALANRVIGEALRAGAVPGLRADTVRAEVRYGTGSRIDFLLENDGGPTTYVEVKSATLSRQPGLAEFPDTTTARGTKHMSELAHVARNGHEAMLIWLVQRTDCTRFAVAADIDPAYAAAVEDARAAGVRMLPLAARISHRGIEIDTPLPEVT